MNPLNPCKPLETEYVVRESCAPNKASWTWKHRRVDVAVLHVDAGTIPKMISLRARGVRDIVFYQGMLFDGRSLRCQASRAREHAEALAARLNAQNEKYCKGKGTARL